MNRTPLYIAIVVSIIAHVVVGETANRFKGDPPGKRRVTVAVVGQEKKKKEEPKPPPPPPPPPPKVAKVAPQPKAEAPPPPAPEPIHTAAPIAAAPTGLEFSNTTGQGVEVGTPAPKATRPDGDAGKPTAVKKPTAVQKPTGAEESQNAGDGPAPCTEDASRPEPIAKTEIEYTEEARANGVEGRLVLKISIDENGAVTDVSVASSVDAALDAAAIAAVKQWRFKPSQKCGKPVAGTYTLARRFELGD
jgi:periplasmic protein TonB